MSILLDTKFADMPSGVANRWLAWAQSHDWGGEAKFLDTGNMFVEHCEPIFSTPRELRDWAGY